MSLGHFHQSSQAFGRGLAECLTTPLDRIIYVIFKFVGFLAHMFSMGFRSGPYEGHSKTSILACW